MWRYLADYCSLIHSISFLLHVSFQDAK